MYLWRIRRKKSNFIQIDIIIVIDMLWGRGDREIITYYN